MNAEMVVYLIAVMLDKGIPALVTLTQNWKAVDPTLEDFEALKSIIIDPKVEP
jgi:hypothetical protein